MRLRHPVPKVCEEPKYGIECLKLQVIFRKRVTNYRALLRTMTHEDKAPYGSSPPCTKNVRRTQIWYIIGTTNVKGPKYGTL